ncbi:MAG: globin [Caulobacteraceae bacterium]
MTESPKFAAAADIEASLDAFAEASEDPVPHVYERLFALHPAMKPYFWRDTNGAIRGEMLSRTVEAIFDFIGERRYADHMLGTEMITHEGYDVPREVFITFFSVIRDTARDLCGGAWTPAFESAWSEMIAEIETYVGLTPRVNAENAYFKGQREKFEAGDVPLPG